jgi:hypothetical protein
MSCLPAITKSDKSDPQFHKDFGKEIVENSDRLFTKILVTGLASSPTF